MISVNPAIILSLLYAIFNVAGAAIIKSKLITNKVVGLSSFINFLIDPKIILSIALIIISMFFSFKALSIAPFSLIAPVTTSISFILTIVIGIIIFNDNLSITGYFGITLILLGVILLSKSYQIG